MIIVVILEFSSRISKSNDRSFCGSIEHVDVQMVISHHQPKAPSDAYIDRLSLKCVSIVVLLVFNYDAFHFWHKNCSNLLKLMLYYYPTRHCNSHKRKRVEEESEDDEEELEDDEMEDKQIIPVVSSSCTYWIHCLKKYDKLYANFHLLIIWLSASFP